MSIDFNFNPASVSAGMEVYPKDEYEISVESIKGFKKEENGVVKNFGIRYICKIQEGPFKGKSYIHNIYLHVESALGMAKQFMMAATGFDKKEEKEFDAKNAGADATFREAGGEIVIGDYWKQPLGKRLWVSLDVGINKENGNEQQKQTGLRPYR